jgi:hypothetical protein
MYTLALEVEPEAAAISIMDEELIVELVDGRSLAVPINWYPRLLHASGQERRNWLLLGGGYAIEWPDIDEHIGVESLLAGRRSGESQSSIDQWLASRNQ